MSTSESTDLRSAQVGNFQVGATRASHERIIHRTHIEAEWPVRHPEIEGEYPVRHEEIEGRFINDDASETL